MNLTDHQFVRVRPYVNGKGIELNVVDRSKERITQRSYFYNFTTVHDARPERLITLLQVMVPQLLSDVNYAVRGIYGKGDTA